MVRKHPRFQHDDRHWNIRHSRKRIEKRTFPRQLSGDSHSEGPDRPGALNGGAPVVFTASDEVQPQAVAYSNVPAGFSINPPLVFYQTSGGAEILLDQNGPTGQYLAIPAGAVPSGDTYFLWREPMPLPRVTEPLTHSWESNATRPPAAPSRSPSPRHGRMPAPRRHRCPRSTLHTQASPANPMSPISPI